MSPLWWRFSLSLVWTTLSSAASCLGCLASSRAWHWDSIECSYLNHRQWWQTQDISSQSPEVDTSYQGCLGERCWVFNASPETNSLPPLHDSYTRSHLKNHTLLPKQDKRDTCLSDERLTKTPFSSLCYLLLPLFCCHTWGLTCVRSTRNPWWVKRASLTS
jgi:hypothetical protein